MASGKNLPSVPTVPLEKWKWTGSHGYFRRWAGLSAAFYAVSPWNNSAFIIISRGIDQLMLANRDNENSGNISTKESFGESFRLAEDAAKSIPIWLDGFTGSKIYKLQEIE